jgi:UDP-N-acetylglucosamine 2-epimerase (non-hydrolysing)
MSPTLSTLAVIGTRPEAIKMAPVIQRLRREPERFSVKVCATAQHREMLDQVFGLFGFGPDIDLDLMKPGQSLNTLSAGIFAALEPVFQTTRPDWVLIQGDTTTAMCSALAAFHEGIPVGHIEAGLRTGDLGHPFPEEMNRRVVDMVASAFFAPTPRAVENLLAQHAPKASIHLTGNTIVDALLEIARHQGPAVTEDLVLVTVHRRENFGGPLSGILAAVARLARAFPHTQFLHVTHPNPSVVSAIPRTGIPPNLEIAEPLDYAGFVHALRRCRLVLTDSGGVQEEAPTFGKPVLVLREKTERPEAVEAGLATLVGTDEESIVRAASRHLAGPLAPLLDRPGLNPYGDGRAADRIADVLAGRKCSAFDPAVPHAAAHA